MRIYTDPAQLAMVFTSFREVNTDGFAARIPRT
jgi:hypothetical protein